jgi:hypothetical protein
MEFMFFLVIVLLYALYLLERIARSLKRIADKLDRQ